MPRLLDDPVDIAIDDLSGDVMLPLRFSRGAEAVRQRVRVRLQMFRGEWFLDLDKGVPWLERSGVPASDALLGQKFDMTRARNAIRDAILYSDAHRSVRDEEVLALTKLDVAFDTTTRKMAVTWQVQTVFGDTPPDTLVPGSVTA